MGGWGNSSGNGFPGTFPIRPGYDPTGGTGPALSRRMGVYRGNAVDLALPYVLSTHLYCDPEMKFRENIRAFLWIPGDY